MCLGVEQCESWRERCCKITAVLTMTAALQPLLNALRQHAAFLQQQEPRQQRGEPSAALTRHAAALVAAARPHAAAARRQVLPTPCDCLQHVQGVCRFEPNMNRTIFVNSSCKAAVVWAEQVR